MHARIEVVLGVLDKHVTLEIITSGHGDGGLGFHGRDLMYGGSILVLVKLIRNYTTDVFYSFFAVPETQNSGLGLATLLSPWILVFIGSK